MNRIPSDSPVHAASKMLADTSAHNVVEAVAEKFQHLAVARKLVPAMLSIGLFGDGDATEFELIEKLAALPTGYLNIKTIYAERCAAKAMPDSQTGLRRLDDLCNSSFVSGAEAGYLLGLAVGQALGPDALKGGAK